MELFSYVEDRTEISGLDLTYDFESWEEPVFDDNTSDITSIHVRMEKEAAAA